MSEKRRGKMVNMLMTRQSVAAFGLGQVRYALASMHISQFDDHAKVTFNRVVFAAHPKGVHFKTLETFSHQRE